MSFCIIWVYRVIVYKSYVDILYQMSLSGYCIQILCWYFVSDEFIGLLYTNPLLIFFTKDFSFWILNQIIFAVLLSINLISFLRPLWYRTSIPQEFLLLFFCLFFLAFWKNRYSSGMLFFMFCIHVSYLCHVSVRASISYFLLDP